MASSRSSVTAQARVGHAFIQHQKAKIWGCKASIYPDFHFSADETLSSIGCAIAPNKRRSYKAQSVGAFVTGQLCVYRQPKNVNHHCQTEAVQRMKIMITHFNHDHLVQLHYLTMRSKICGACAKIFYLEPNYADP